MFFKMGVLINFVNFTGKHLCWSLFLVKLPASRPATLLKRDPNTEVFSCEIFKNTFFAENFQWLLLNLRSKQSGNEYWPVYIILQVYEYNPYKRKLFL